MAETAFDWRFPCSLLNVVDGDTLDLLCDLGFKTRYAARVRLVGIDTAEIYGVSHDSEEYELGMTQKRYVEDWFDERSTGMEWPFTVSTQKTTGKYGRWAGEVEAKNDGALLTVDLMNEWPEVSD